VKRLLLILAGLAALCCAQTVVVGAVTTKGALVNGNCVEAAGSSSLQDSGSACGSGGGLTTVSKATSYTLVAGDFGATKLLAFDCTGVCAATLPSTAPAANGTVSIANSGVYVLIVNANGLNLDGVGAPIYLAAGQGMTLASDGSNYFTVRGGGTPNWASRWTITAGPSNDKFNYTNSEASTGLSTCSGSCQVAGAYPENPGWYQLLTDTTANHLSFVYGCNEGDCGSYGNASHPTELDMKVWLGICGGSINPANAGTNQCTTGATASNVRVWFGFLAGLGENLTTQAGTDTLFHSSGSGNAAFRYSTAASDATVKCVTVNAAGTQNVADTGAAPDAVIHLWEVKVDDLTGNVWFLRDGAPVCSSPVSTDPPVWNGTGTPNAPFAAVSVTTLSTVAAQLQVGQMVISGNQGH
jgi:uncharacterized protein (UPF0333 family)